MGGLALASSASGPKGGSVSIRERADWVSPLIQVNEMSEFQDDARLK
jgi:hypothetical protein